MPPRAASRSCCAGSAATRRDHGRSLRWPPSRAGSCGRASSPWPRCRSSVSACAPARPCPARLTHLRVDLGADARLELRFEDRVEWPRRAFGGTGPAQIVPGLPQYWHPHLLGGRVSGSGWDGAVVYAEKNWGPRFTEHWWWGQAQAFEGADACVAFAGGRVLGGAPTGVVVRVEDRVLRLSPPFARARERGGRGRLAGPRPLRRAGRSRSRPRAWARRRSCRSRCPASAGSSRARSST